MSSISEVVSAIAKGRRLIWPLVAQEFRQRYAGSLIGFAWAFINPALTLTVLWVVMGYGLRLETLGPAPFFLVLLTKFLPWLLFSEAVGSGSGAVASRSYLVTKIAFPLELLPLVSIVLAAIVHLALISVFVLTLFLHGYPLTISVLYVPVLALALCLFSLSLNLLLSVLVVFFKDLLIAVPAVLNIWFWLTPIVWPLSTMPASAQAVLALNPMAFIVEGYAHALLGAPLPVTFPLMALSFAVWTIGSLMLGAWTFHRLRPHIADVL